MYKDHNGDGENSLKIYLREINEFPLLTPDEEKKLGEKIALGDEKAKEKMINSNLRFVVKIAKGFQGQGLPLEDLISEGNRGLIHAAEMFDYNKGYRFSTYSQWWIRSKLQRAVGENKGISPRKFVIMKNIFYLINHGKSVEEISELLQMDSEKIKYFMDMPNLVVSLDEEVSDGENLTYQDFVSDERYLPEDNLRIVREKIFSILKELKPREAEVIKMRFGFIDGHCRTLEEVGMKYNVTRERARQIEEKALRRLRNPIYQSTFESCLEK